jgi:hypothetical protein
MSREKSGDVSAAPAFSLTRALHQFAKRHCRDHRALIVKAARETPGKKIDICLTNRLASVTVFQKLARCRLAPFVGPGDLGLSRFAPKKLRKGGVNPRKSLARVNLGNYILDLGTRDVYRFGRRRSLGSWRA